MYEFKKIGMCLKRFYITCTANTNLVLSLEKNDNLRSLSKEEKALINFKNDKTILICKPDNGQGAAILDKKSYLTKMENFSK